MIDFDRLARPGSKKRKVLDLLADGKFHSGSELHRAFGSSGWTWDSAVAQLRATLRPLGGDVKHRCISRLDRLGRREGEYRLVLPPEPWNSPRRVEAVIEIVREAEQIAPCGDHVDCGICINREDCQIEAGRRPERRASDGRAAMTTAGSHSLSRSSGPPRLSSSRSCASASRTAQGRLL